MQQSVRAHLEGDVLAVVSQSGPTVSFFDAGTDRHLGTIEVPAEPHELCFDPTQRLLWCATTYHSGYYHANSGRRSELTVIDPATRSIVEVIDLAPEHGPHGLALDAAHGRLYVSVEGSDHRPGGVVVVDTTTRRPIGRIDTDAPGPHWFVIDPTGTTGYASNKEAPFVSVVDLNRGTLTAKVEVPGSEGLAVSADGSKVFVAAPYAAFGGKPDEPSNPAGPSPRPTTTGIRVIDTATMSITDTLPTDHIAIPVHTTGAGADAGADATTSRLLVGEPRMETTPESPLGRHAPGRLTVFAADSHDRLGSVEVGHLPLTITSSADGRFGYVACVVSSTVDIIDLESLRNVGQLEVTKRAEPGAHGMAYIPQPA
ncbi:YncE family protein [Streptomyces zagrosensis]|uniref:DNA-binding beta-propeller fold protein YncE n=1 Tax=Streptomyces zagrosensis TaxID=1042984 RepID=A0A7W9Q6F7_9ACTN|nr:YncE family protein [Streptomyces zagrosensis]MBB5934489.1 DNA-binding beta-propeller fold protein YncE [Streptomyces zagrosensis]